MNAGGEGIAHLGENALQIMTTQLETLKKDSNVKSLELNVSENTLLLKVNNLDASQANGLLEDCVKAKAEDSK